MTKEELITELFNIKTEIRAMTPRKGRADFLRYLDTTKTYLARYRTDKNIHTLLYKEVQPRRETLCL